MPFESAAATDNDQGPVGDPLYAGIATTTSLLAAVTELIVNCAPDDVPPPGEGVVTLTVPVPDKDNWLVGITAVSVVDEAKVVVSVCPLKFTIDALLKSVPVSVIVVSDEPEGAEDGKMFASVGNAYFNDTVAEADLLLSAWHFAVTVTAPGGAGSGAT